MAYRENLQLWVRESLGELGGEGTIKQVAKQLWNDRQTELKQDEHFYTWQYDMRWAAQRLREKGLLGLRKQGSTSVWTLKK